MYVGTGNEFGAISKYHREFEYHVTWENAHELYFTSNFTKRNLFESIIIKSIFENNINISVGLYHSNKIIEHFTEKFKE